MKVKILKKPVDAISKLRNIDKKFKGSPELRVGLPASSNPYPDGTSVIMVGFVHEFGSEAKKIPERSFLRSTIKDKRKKYLSRMKLMAVKAVDGNTSIKKLFGLFGLQVVGDVQKKIVDLRTPANKPSTVQAKKSTNPLIDTGHLRQSITFEIK